MIALAMAMCGVVYHLLVIIAVSRFPRRRHVSRCSQPVSILKPVRGKDAGFYRAIRSHALLDYPAGFELLFGVSDPNDLALADIARLRTEFPTQRISVVDTRNDAPNGKVGSLEILAQHARHEFLVLNDSDIYVEPQYLALVASLLAEEGTGVVTCLYRGSGSSFPARLEALGVATEFAPSVVVARMLFAGAFAFGSTIALRKADLEAMGGFRAIRNYLADDFQIGVRVAKSGKKVIIADEIVETSLGAGTWTDMWKHQLRWSRTIRVSNPAGYFGYVVTQLTFWCLMTAFSGYSKLAVAGLGVRLVAAAVSATWLRDSSSTKMLWAVPFRDLLGTAVWAAGMVGDTVEWRGLRFRLSKDGTIRPMP